MVERMKSMPGMGGLESLLRRGGGKPDLAAMQAHLQRNTRMATQRDRMRAKLAERQRNAPPAPPAAPGPTDGQKDPSVTGSKKKRRKKKKQRVYANIIDISSFQSQAAEHDDIFDNHIGHDTCNSCAYLGDDRKNFINLSADHEDIQAGVFFKGVGGPRFA